MPAFFITDDSGAPDLSWSAAFAATGAKLLSFKLADQLLQAKFVFGRDIEETGTDPKVIGHYDPLHVSDFASCKKMAFPVNLDVALGFLIDFNLNVFFNHR